MRWSDTLLTWDDTKIVAGDLETSGKLKEYALQPWRMARGDAWITSGSFLHHDGMNSSIPLMSQLFPTKAQILAVLERILFNDWTVLGWNITFDVGMLMALGDDVADLCMQIKWLDGMLMWRHYDIEPEYEFQTAKHLKRSYSLKGYTDDSGRFFPGAMQTWLPHVPLYNENVDFHATDPANLARLQKYNDDDNIHTRIIARLIWQKLTAVQRRAVLIQAEAIPLVAQANLLGLPIDVLTCKHLGAKLDIDAASYLHELAPDGITEAIVRSPKKLGELMFDVWKLPVLKENKSKVEGKAPNRSTDKEVLHELAFVDGRAKKIKLYRETLNARGKFCESVLESVRYNEDGRTHPVAKLFGTYCVPGDVEVMTRRGWVALQDWEGGEIAQVHPDQRIEFLPAERFVGPITDMWVRVTHRRLECDFTPGHKVPYLDRRDGSWQQMCAGEITPGVCRDLPVAGRLACRGRLTPLQMQLIVAAQADGYFRPRRNPTGEIRGAQGIKFTLKKARKIERLRELLNTAQIKFRERRWPSYPDRAEIAVSGRDMPEWLTPACKTFGPWLLDTTPEGLEAFVAELHRWDGTADPRGGKVYVSNVKGNVDWACTIASLAGRKASVHTPHKGMHRVLISDARAVVSVQGNRHVSHEMLDQRAYCATTKTGFWLARSKGHIFVTGNTDRMTVASKQGRGKDEVQIGFALHQMKREKEFREIVTVEEGYDIVEADAAGQEFRWMAVASNDQTMLNLCLPGEDAHTYMGSQIVAVDYIEMLRKVHEEDKTAGQNRYLGKFANLSLQYRTSARKLRSKARVDYDIPLELPEAQRIHATYQRVYPGVPDYWESQIAKVKGLGYVETFGGNRIKVEGDWQGTWGWSMGSTAINARIQGTGADQKHLAMAIIKDYLRTIGGRLMFDLHDGLYMAIPSAVRPKAVDTLKRLLDNLPYQAAWGFTPPIPMPWDIKVGKAWGRLKEVKFA